MSAIKPNKDIIYDAIVAMRDAGEYATRKKLLNILDLKRSIIDDNINTLIHEGRIYSVERGIYAPLFEHPPSRIISKTPLPCGLVKVEIGDDVWTLTPFEARTLGACFMAEAMQYSNIELGRHMAQIEASNKLKMKLMEAENRALKAQLEK